ncbi:MAG: protein kinase [Candidatus Obscuribacterales bacterium]|nr:protein kinase [Candidatus Obscuribacterales bacterium]
MLEDLQGQLTKRCVTCDRKFSDTHANCPSDGTVLIPIAQDPWVGKKLTEHYEVLSLVGHGGMGVVYKAKHDLMERYVAIKMLLAQHITDSQSVRRFQHEAKAASKLSHPNIITLYDYGVSPTGQPYLVMDYLEGISLADIIKSDGQIGCERGVKIFLQVCDALEHAHNQKLVHRDLKPGNVMLINNEDLKDFVKVVDFGVSKIMGSDEAQRLTQTGEICGSPVYMSPEQCEGKKLDPRSDVYSMGVLMYEALTGELPLMGKTMVETMSKHLGEKPPRFASVREDLYIPERLENVVFHCLEKNPADRPQSMAALKEELIYSIPQTRPPGEEPPSVRDTPRLTYAMSKPIGKGRYITIYILLALVLMALCFAIARYQQIKPQKKPTVAAPLVKPSAVKPTVEKPPAAPPEVVAPPKTEAPKTEIPKIEAPKAEAPKPIKTARLKIKSPVAKSKIKKPAAKPADPWGNLELESSGRKYAD